MIAEGHEAVAVYINGHDIVPYVREGHKLRCSMFQYRDGLIRIDSRSECDVTEEVRVNCSELQSNMLFVV